MWLALGPQRWFARLQSVLPLAALMGYAIFVGFVGVRYAIGDPIDLDPLLWLFLIVVVSTLGVSFCIALLSLGVARAAFGWRIERAGTVTAASAVKPAQFTIRHLLGWTAVVALVLGLGRVLVPPPVRFNANDLSEIVIVITVATILANVAAPPWIWIAFLKRGLPRWITAALMYTVAVTVVEVALFSDPIPPLFWKIDFWYWGAGDFAAYHMMHILVLTISLVVLRAAGYRLVRNGTSRID